jgi:hypothetical protein
VAAGSLFDSRERAALAWTETVTRVADTAIPDGEFESASMAFSEKELANPTIAIGLMNAYNRLAIGFRNPPKVSYLNVNEASFANLSSVQMRVMKYGKAASELVATANISAFNIANALGELIGRRRRQFIRSERHPFCRGDRTRGRAPLDPVAGARCSSGLVPTSSQGHDHDFHEGRCDNPDQCVHG